MKFIKKPSSKYIKFGLKALVSLFFIFWIVFKVDWTNVIKNIQTISLFYLVIYIVVVILGIAISSYKWKILANFKNINLSFINSFKLYLTGTFINNFMPSFIGGDTYKAYGIGKPSGKYIEATSSVVMDRIIGLFGATVLAVFFSLLNLKNIISNSTLVVVNLLVILSLSVDIFIAKIRKHSFWSRIKKYFPEKLVALVADMGTYNNNSKIFKRAILWTFVFNFIGIALANYIIFLALGIEIGVLNYLSVIFLISIVASIPISINNIGIKEWAYITFFGAFGLSASSVVTVAIVSRLIQMLISFFALPFYLKRKKKVIV